MFNEHLSATRYVPVTDLDPDSAVMQVSRLIGRDRRVLEIGPATGTLTRILAKNQGCSVTAIEIDPEAAALVSRLCTAVHVADIENCELSALLGSQRFDFITFGDVLEHLHAPAFALRKARQFLAPGGSIIASVPNIAHAAIAYELAHGRFNYQPIGLLDATHVRFFTKRSFIELFEEAGYNVLSLSRYHQEPENTEFRTLASSDAQSVLLQYLRTANPEASTYQFIAQAVPMHSDLNQPDQAAFVRAEEKLAELEAALIAEQARVRRLQSEVSWLEKRWPNNWLKRLRRQSK